MKYKWSDQALYLQKKLNLTEQEIADCEEWISENVFVVGDSWVLMWLHANHKKDES